MSDISKRTIEGRVEALEQRVAAIEDIKAELAHWIGEAKRFEWLYRSADERAQRWYRQLTDLRHEAGEQEAMRS